MAPDEMSSAVAGIGREGGAAAGLTWLPGTALYIGAVLGTGVIALPALAARTAGPASLLAWLALVLLSIPLAATFSALGARYPDSGGIATCVSLAFGSYPAAIVGWCFLFAVPVGAPAAAMFAGAYVQAAVGGGASTLVLTALSLVLGITLINAFGVTLSGRVQVLVAGLLIAFLATAVCVSLPHFKLQNLHPFAPHGWLAVASAAGLLVWSFAGWEAITYLAAEFREPARDMPRAAAVAVIVIGVLYIAIAVATILVLGAGAAATTAPLAVLLAFGFGGPVKLLAAAAAVLLTAGTMNAYFAGAAKLGAALGRDGALPAWFAHGSESGGIPRRSLLSLAALTLVVLIATAMAHVHVDALVLMTTGAFVIVYILGTAAALRLLEAGSWGRRAALLALIFDVLLLATTGTVHPMVGCRCGLRRDLPVRPPQTAPPISPEVSPMRARPLIARVLAALLGVASAHFPAARAGAAASAADTTWFLQRTQALYDALAPGDKAIWRRTLADDCIVTDEDGRVYGKTAFLDTLTGLPPGFSGVIRIRGLAARIFGTAASVHYWIDEHEDALGQRLHTTYVETDTYRREAGTWKMIAAQVTVVPADLEPVPVDRSGWPELAGSYRLGAGSGPLYHAYLRNGSLYWGGKESSAKLLIPLSPLVFFVQGSIHTMVFVRDSSGHVTEAIELHKYNEIALRRVRNGG